MTLFLAVYLPLCCIVGYVAGQRGRSGVGLFFISLIFTPIVGLLVAMALPTKSQSAPRANDLVRCWHCRELKTLAVPQCPHCGSSAEPPMLQPPMKKCPICAELIQPDALKCRYCGADQAIPTLASEALPSLPPPAITQPVGFALPGKCPDCGRARFRLSDPCVGCGSAKPAETA